MSLTADHLGMADERPTGPLEEESNRQKVTDRVRHFFALEGGEGMAPAPIDMRRLKMLIAGIVIAVVVVALGAGVAFANIPEDATSSQPWVASDFDDYAPGATVVLTGGNWQPGESVHVFVDDDLTKSWTHDSAPDPVADENGAFTYSFDLPAWFVATYTVYANGDVSGSATTTFTDAVLPSRGCADPGAGNPIVVDTPDDEFTTNTGGSLANRASGPCSLREAISAANGDPAADTINLDAGTYTLEISGTGAAIETGDLDVTRPLTINGAGARTTIIEGGTDLDESVDRVFHATQGLLSMSDLTVRHGKINENGGGLFIESSASVSLQDVTITNNETTSDKNGAGLWSNRATTLDRVTISDNVAGGNSQGGGLWLDQNSTLTNVTVTNNTAASGAGIFVNGNNVTLVNATVSHNTGIGIRRSSGNVNLRNTIVASNTGSSCSGTIGNTANNLDSGTSCFGASPLNNSQSSADPLLGGLQDNGGPTDTRAIPSTSPAKDAGTATSAPSVDQRGIARPQPAGGAHDIGAYEFEAAAGPTKLAFTTSAHTGAVDACLGPITVQTQDASSVATNPSSATVVGLSSDGTGAFFSDNACATALTVADRTIPSSANSFGFYYRATARGDGTHELTASATDLTSAAQTQTIDKIDQTVSFTSTAPEDAVVGGTYLPTATGGGSGNAILFGASGGCSYNILTGVTFTSATSCTVTADQAGNDDYNDAPQASQTLDVDKADQDTLTVTDPDDGTYGEKLTPAATGGSGTGALSFTASGTACEMGSGADEGKLVITSGTGTCEVTAHKAADDNYNATSSVAHTVDIHKADQAIDFTSTEPGNAVYGDTYTPAATGGDSGNTVTFGASGACSYSSGVVTMDDVGECTVTADQTGDDNYNDAPQSSQVFEVGKKTLGVKPDPFGLTRQYSDNNPGFSPDYTETDFVVGDDADDLGEEPVCSTTATVSSAPNAYAITCSGGVDDHYSFSFTNGTLTIVKEDATAAFQNTNPAATQVSAPGGSLPIGGVTLNVDVVEKQPDLPTALAAAGDIDNAGLSVTLSPVGPGSGFTLNCTSGDAATGYATKTFACTNTASLPINTYEVTAAVTGDYYVAPNAFDAFTVYDPSLGFATGGGHTTIGGEKVNFGFTMKYNKSGTNLQGNFIAIRHHADGTVSRMKSNSLAGLAIQTNSTLGCGYATFSGKSTYSTWDAALNGGLGGYVNTGNSSFTIYAEDCNNPGIGIDQIWVGGPELLRMSATSAGKTPLVGGNITVPHTYGKK